MYIDENGRVATLQISEVWQRRNRGQDTIGGVSDVEGK
jgi:hypothetical protein